MGKWNEIKEKISAAWAGTEDFRHKAGVALEKTGYVLQVIWKWFYNLRSIILAVPVVFFAIKLAIQNLARLPQAVGINLLATGNYQWMVGRTIAVMGPLAITAACLFLMFISKRVVYPWLISIFSLIIPVMIYITNVFPA